MRIHAQAEHKAEQANAKADHQQRGAGDTAKKNRLPEVGQLQIRFASGENGGRAGSQDQGQHEKGPCASGKARQRGRLHLGKILQRFIGEKIFCNDWNVTLFHTILYNGLIQSLLRIHPK